LINTFDLQGTSSADDAALLDTLVPDDGGVVIIVDLIGLLDGGIVVDLLGVFVALVLLGTDVSVIALLGVALLGAALLDDALLDDVSLLGDVSIITEGGGGSVGVVGVVGFVG
jgi:hypothetical protein